MNLNGRKVIRVTTHSPVHIQDLGQLSSTFMSKQANRQDIEIEKVEGGVFLSGKTISGVKFEKFVPDGNIISLDLAPIKADASNVPSGKPTVKR